MKKKLITILSVLIIIVASVIGGRALVLHMKYEIPDQVYFGENYSEIFHIPSLRDKKIADELLETVDSAFSFIGTEDEAKEKYGVLSRYSVKNELDVKLKEEHKIKLITADFKESSGYMWIEYSQKVYTDFGGEGSGSHNILVRMTLEKNNEKWMVTACKEHP